MVEVIDGKAIAARVRAEVAERVAGIGFVPGLAVVQLGANPASSVYVRTKDRAAKAAGISARTISLPESTSQAELLETIETLNRDDSVDGILVQLPLPPGLSPHDVIAAIDPAKDVDGFHPINVGYLTDGRPKLVPCTPKGVMRLLREAGISPSGTRAVVLGRSSIVGRPMASLLLTADATVTIAHSRTRNLAEECRRADILVAAVGRPEMVPGAWIKPGATVIDVGINRLANGKLVGDVDFAACAKVAGAITPVPGGVGPMTVACLLENTLTAAIRRRS
ncbi:MAG TPA: bifunctional methylenetetrahydrofolate dehydrogenase/methenyltetrahydrofolate cyclohydrolase FolD [Rhodopila sp.]|nr:bifunctional methylenetetrahydrofolate dehydrogenase/methenyltetrahydrofolate cyclohydrolase FolD [Rhodopila sp.]